jgi:hypothetical protein
MFQSLSKPKTSKMPDFGAMLSENQNSNGNQKLDFL